MLITLIVFLYMQAADQSGIFTGAWPFLWEDLIIETWNMSSRARHRTKNEATYEDSYWWMTLCPQTRPLKWFKRGDYIKGEHLNKEPRLRYLIQMSRYVLITSNRVIEFPWGHHTWESSGHMSHMWKSYWKMTWLLFNTLICWYLSPCLS